MRIAVINPNTSEVMTEHILEAAGDVTGSSVGLAGFAAQRGPAAVESSVDEAYAAAEVASIVTRGPDFDAYIVACAGDPCLTAARELTPAPADGIGEASFLLAGLATSKVRTYSYPEPLPYGGMTTSSQARTERRADDPR